MTSTVPGTADVLRSLVPSSWGFLSPLCWIWFPIVIIVVVWILYLFLSWQLPCFAGPHPAAASWEWRHTGAKFWELAGLKISWVYSHTWSNGLSGPVIIGWKQAALQDSTFCISLSEGNERCALLLGNPSKSILVLDPLSETHCSPWEFSGWFPYPPCSRVSQGRNLVFSLSIVLHM